MSESTGLVIWEKVDKTPPQFLKQFKRAGGFAGKSIDPTYRIKLLTQVFGPCGIGWRFVCTKMWIESIEGKTVAFVTGYLDYRPTPESEWVSTSSHTGGTVCEARAPDECFKMSETDSLGKCCLDLGLAADVYFGQHDGDKYQRNMDVAPIETQVRSVPEPARISERKSEPWGVVVEWREATVPPVFKKHGGRKLGSFEASQLGWFCANYKANEKYEDSVNFRAALDAAQEELGL